MSSTLQDSVPLKVTEPQDAANLNTSTVTVKGQTKPGATVNVNDEVGVADASGNFSVAIELEDGPNAIDVIAVDDSGKEGEILLLVNVIPSVTSAAINSNPAAEYTDGDVPLKIIQPLDSSTVNSNTVVVKGQTVPGALVCVNDETATADAAGNFSVSISLESGPNAIDIIAFDDDGNDGEVVLMVNSGA